MKSLVHLGETIILACLKIVVIGAGIVVVAVPGTIVVNFTQGNWVRGMELGKVAISPPALTVDVVFWIFVLILGSLIFRPER